MSTFASALIDALGGTAKVASLAETPMSTVHNMRRRLTESRLNHLRRIAEDAGLGSQVMALAADHGVMLKPLRSDVGHQAGGTCNGGEASSGTPAEISSGGAA
ncbi:hypothetical protein GCM10022253_23840 [Sphingomonas endophytica]